MIAGLQAQPVCVTSCKRAVFPPCQRVLTPASERARHRRMGPLSPPTPLPVGAARQAFGRSCHGDCPRMRWRRSLGRTAGGCGACVVVTGGGCWKDQAGQRGGRGARGPRAGLPGRSFDADRSGLAAAAAWPGAAGRAARLPPAGRSGPDALPSPWGTLVPHRAADPVFPRCRPAGRARRGDVAGSGLAVARTLGGHFRHLPGGAAHVTSRTRRTGPW